MPVFLFRPNNNNKHGGIKGKNIRNNNGSSHHKAKSRLTVTASVACVIVLALMYVASPPANEELLLERQQVYHRQQQQQQHQETRRQSSLDLDPPPESFSSSPEKQQKAQTQQRRNNVQVVAFDSSNSQQSTQFSAIECNIDEFDLGEDNNNAMGAGSERPVILHGWEIPKGDHWRSEASFLSRLGNLPFYIKDKYVQVRGPNCVARFRDLWGFIKTGLNKKSMLAFTNNKENTALFEEHASDMDYDIPKEVEHIDSFAILSTMTNSQSHEFHRHGESWIGQSAGHKVWWFLPPTEAEAPIKVNACGYLTGEYKVPPGATTCVQSPGDIIWFPKDWYHATCSLSDWTVGIGQQLGPRINQEFPTLDVSRAGQDAATVQNKLEECSGQSSSEQQQQQQTPRAEISTAAGGDKTDEWKWYNGDMNTYYNDLEKDHKRNPNDINAYAVHRWLGPKRSTQVHYQLIHDSILRHMRGTQMYGTSTDGISLLDAGCGLGSALMWMEQTEPSWKLTGRTLSEGQLGFINNDLPEHNFNVELGSYDDLNEGVVYDAIYSIEAMIHSYDIVKTLKAWSKHLHPDHGTLVVIDDFLMPGADKNDPEVELFAKSWLANSLHTVTELNNMARQVGLELVESRDILSEYRVIELNYKNQLPNLSPEQNRNHQGWMGSKYRQKLTVEGKVGYSLVTFQKMGAKKTAR